MDFIKITKDNIDILKEFVNENNDEELISYFSTFDHVFNHFITLIAKKDNINVGYCHINAQNNKFWFGIHIVNGYRNKGNGFKIMKNLFSLPEIIALEVIYLTVNTSNIIAIKLYQKFGFEIFSESYYEDSKIYFMRKNFL